MDLPRIPKDRLTKELREVVGETDLEFDAIVDPQDIVSLKTNLEEYTKGKIETAKMLVESRQKLEEYRRELRRIERMKYENPDAGTGKKEQQESSKEIN